MTGRKGLWQRYMATILEFRFDGVLRIDLRKPPNAEAKRRLAQLGLEGPFAVITACNPNGDELTAENNRERSRTLELEMADTAGTWIRTDGVSPGGNHREPGIAVGCERDWALELGRRHGQLAIYWYDGRQFWLVPCDTGLQPKPLPEPQ